MKKVYLLIITFVCSINVYAYELKCPSNSFQLNDTFKCYIENDTLNDYTYIKGSIDNNEYIECSVDSYSAGLQEIEFVNNKFNLSGKPRKRVFVYFNCKVIKDISTSSKNVTLSINDFSYNIDGDKSQILTSDYIKIKKYVADEDTRPRDTSNSNSLLKKLIINEIEFTFSRNITIYNFEVTYDIQSLNINYNTINSNATVLIQGDTNLKIGDNVIDIYVTSPDNKSTTCYTLNIIRLDEGIEKYNPEEDIRINDIKIIGHDFKFDINTKSYKVNLLEEETSLSIEVIPFYKGSNIKISNTKNLKTGDVISITITSEDGTKTDEYKIIIEGKDKVDYTESYKKLILIGIGVFVLLIMFFIFNSKKKVKKKRDKKPKKEKVKKEEIKKEEVLDELDLM